MLVGTDVCVRMVFVWEKTGVPRGNSPVWLGDQTTISHDDVGYRSWVAAVRGECVNTAPARQQSVPVFHNMTSFSWLNNNEIKNKGDDDSDGDGDDDSDGDGNDDIDDDMKLTAVGCDGDDDMFYSFLYWLAIELVILYSI